MLRKWAGDVSAGNFRLWRRTLSWGPLGKPKQQETASEVVAEKPEEAKDVSDAVKKTREPFVKRFYTGEIDKQVLGFPELDRHRLKKLNDEILPSLRSILCSGRRHAFPTAIVK